MKRIAFILCGVILLSFGAASAERQIINLGDSEAGVRTVGGNYIFNCWPPIGPGLVVGTGEVREFVLRVDETVCDPGFQVFSVGSVFWPPTQDFYTFDVDLVVREAVEASPDCLVPGDVLITFGPYSTVDSELSPGSIYYSEYVLDLEHCIEAELDYFVGWIVSNHGPAIEMQMGNCWTDPCEAYASDGAGGWDDTVIDLGHGAQTMIWFNYDCCQNPVATEASSWSSVKALY